MLALSRINNMIYINTNHSQKIILRRHNTDELHKIIIDNRYKINSIKNHILQIHLDKLPSEYRQQISELQNVIIKHNEELLKKLCSDDNVTKYIIDNINRSFMNKIIMLCVIIFVILFALKKSMNAS